MAGHFDADDKCPICHNWFKSDHCPHGYGEAYDFIKIANSPTTKLLNKRLNAMEKQIDEMGKIIRFLITKIDLTD